MDEERLTDFINNDEAARARDEGTEGVTVSSQNSGRVLFALNNLKVELLTEIRSSFVALQKEICEKMGVASAGIVEKIVARAGAIETDDSVRFVDLKGKFQINVRLLQWAFVVTVMSFTLSVPSSRTWIADLTYEKLANRADIISKSSRLSMLLFSVKKCASKDRFQSHVGRLWSLVLRRAITSAILHAKKHVFGSKEIEEGGEGEGANQPPAWLVALGSPKTIIATVNDTVDRLECKEGSTSSTLLDFEASSRKRRKLSDGTDAFTDLKARAVKDIRAIWMKTMSYGRTEVCSHLYLSFLFLVEKISEFPSVKAAAASGYEVLFESGTGVIQQEVCEASELPGSIWDIPNSNAARVKEARDIAGAGQDGVIRAQNMARLDALQENFPSLTVTLRYKRKVQSPANVAAGGRGENAEQ